MNYLKSICLLGIASIAVWSCKTANTGSESSLMGAEIQKITCSKGELVQFTFSPPSGIVMPGTFDFAGRSDFNVLSQDVANSDYIRFDTCWETETPNLKQVIFNDSSKKQLLVSTKFPKVLGLAEAVSGDYSKLDIAADAGASIYIVIKGYRKNFVNTAVALRAKGTSADKLKADSDYIMAGNITVGNPLDDGSVNACPNNSAANSTQFQLGTALFNLDFCKSTNADNSTNYKITKVSVLDDNANIPVDEQVEVVIKDPSQITLYSGSGSKKAKQLALPRVTYSVNKDNGCDGLLIETNFSTYGITASPTTSCSKTFPGIPPRKIGVDMGQILYSIKYGSKPPITGNLTCNHPLNDCSLNNYALDDGQFTTSLNSHGWNQTGFKVSGTTFSFQTDTSTSKVKDGNIGPGYRPKMQFNQITMATNGQAPLTAYADAAQPKGFCKTVGTWGTKPFPLKASDLLADFGLPATLSKQDIAEKVIAKPDSFKVGNLSMFTGDVLCMFSPAIAFKNEALPKLVWFWSPRYHSDTELAHFIFEWSKPNATTVIDGVRTQLKNISKP
jgi:hypothetical protein